MSEATSPATTSTDAVVAEVMRELAALENPQMREMNERRGDDHGVNLSQLRALAKRLKTQHELARELWATDDTAAQLLAPDLPPEGIRTRRARRNAARGARAQGA